MNVSRKIYRFTTFRILRNYLTLLRRTKLLNLIRVSQKLSIVMKRIPPGQPKDILNGKTNPIRSCKKCWESAIFRERNSISPKKVQKSITKILRTTFLKLTNCLKRKTISKCPIQPFSKNKINKKWRFSPNTELRVQKYVDNPTARCLNVGIGEMSKVKILKALSNNKETVAPVMQSLLQELWNLESESRLKMNEKWNFQQDLLYLAIAIIRDVMEGTLFWWPNLVTNLVLSWKIVRVILTQKCVIRNVFNKRRYK